MQRYEYNFVRLEQGWLGGPSRDAFQSYQQIVANNAHEGWRLVQIFAPGLQAEGKSSFFELIFERPVEVSRD